MRNHFNMLTSSNDFFVKICAVHLFGVPYMCSVRDFYG